MNSRIPTFRSRTPALAPPPQLPSPVNRSELVTGFGDYLNFDTNASRASSRCSSLGVLRPQDLDVSSLDGSAISVFSPQSRDDQCLPSHLLLPSSPPEQPPWINQQCLLETSDSSGDGSIDKSQLRDGGITPINELESISYTNHWVQQTSTFNNQNETQSSMGLSLEDSGSKTSSFSTSNLIPTSHNPAQTDYFLTRHNSNNNGQLNLTFTKQMSPFNQNELQSQMGAGLQDSALFLTKRSIAENFDPPQTVFFQPRHISNNNAQVSTTLTKKIPSFDQNDTQSPMGASHKDSGSITGSFSTRSSIATSTDSAETVLFQPRHINNSQLKGTVAQTMSSLAPNSLQTNLIDFASPNTPEVCAPNRDSVTRNSLATLVSPNCTNLGEKNYAVFCDFAPPNCGVAVNESFQSNADNLKIMEEAERQFNKEDLHHGHHNFSTAVDLDETVSKLSESLYFMMHTSRLGSLGEEDGRPPSDENRPALGLGKIVSPKNKPFKVALDPDVSKKSQVAKNLVSSSVSKNSKAANAFDSLGSKTEKSSTNSASNSEGEQLKAIKDLIIRANLDPIELTKLILTSQSSPAGSSEVLSQILGALTKNQVQGPNENQKGGSNETQLLPSFLESSLFEGEYPPVSNEPIFKLPQVEDVVAKNRRETSKRLPPVAAARHSSPMKKFRPSRTSTTSKSPAIDIAIANTSTIGASEFLNPNTFNLNTNTTKVINPNNAFPISADRRNITWLASPVGLVDKTTFNLKNILRQDVNVVLRIRESDQFKFVETNSSISEINFLASMTKEVSICFVPSSAGWASGKLVIKLASATKGPGLKAIINLRGYAGKPDIIFEHDGKELLNDLNLGCFTPRSDQQKIQIRNKGDTAGFVTITSPDNHLSIEPSHFVVSPGDVKSIIIKIGENVTEKVVTGSLIIFQGSEICRQACKLIGATSVPGVDLHCVFEGEDILGDDLKKCSLMERDLIQLYSTTKKRVIEYQGMVLSNSGVATFSPLPVEETLNESRFNLTIHQSPQVVIHPPSTIEEEKHGEEVTSPQRVYPLAPNLAHKSRSNNVFYPSTLNGTHTSISNNLGRSTSSNRDGSNNAVYPSNPKLTHTSILNNLAQTTSSSSVVYPSTLNGTNTSISNNLGHSTSSNRDGSNNAVYPSNPKLAAHTTILNNLAHTTSSNTSVIPSNPNLAHTHSLSNVAQANVNGPCTLDPFLQSYQTETRTSPKVCLQSDPRMDHLVSPVQKNINKVVLESDVVIFEPTALGSASIKGNRIRNKSSKSVTFYPDEIHLPFAITSKVIQVKPMCYVGFKVQYLPHVPGNHEATLVLRSKEGLVLKAHLKGCTNVRPQSATKATKPGNTKQGEGSFNSTQMKN